MLTKLKPFAGASCSGLAPARGLKIARNANKTLKPDSKERPGMSKVPPTETNDADLAPLRPASLREAAFEARKRAEAQIILAALDQHRWNRRRAAEALKISYRSLMYKMKYCGLRNGAPAPAPENPDNHD
jgi:two-component system, NtrC family, response regulator AtoC